MANREFHLATEQGRPLAVVLAPSELAAKDAAEGLSEIIGGKPVVVREYLGFLWGKDRLSEPLYSTAQGWVAAAFL